MQTIDATCPLVTKVHREAVKFAARGLHDRPDRPRRPRGGRGHDGRGARAHRARGDRGGRRHARGPRSRAASPTSRRPRCRSTRRARSSTGCARSSRRSPGRAPTTSATRPPTARRRSSRWPPSATWCWSSAPPTPRTRSASSTSRATAAPTAHLIDNEGEVQEEWLEGARVVGISSGASAPEELVDRLVEFFRDRGTQTVEKFEVAARGRALHAAEGDPAAARRPRRLGTNFWHRGAGRKGGWLRIAERGRPAGGLEQPVGLSSVAMRALTTPRDPSSAQDPARSRFHRASRKPHPPEPPTPPSSMPEVHPASHARISSPCSSSRGGGSRTGGRAPSSRSGGATSGTPCDSSTGSRPSSWRARTPRRRSLIGPTGTPAARSTLDPVLGRLRAEDGLELGGQLVDVRHARLVRREALVAGQLGQADRLAQPREEASLPTATANGRSAAS